MKTYKIILFTLLLLPFQSQSQVNPHAIGARLIGSHHVVGHGGVEFSYQHGFGEKNRLELDAGFYGNPNYHHLALTGIFHWDWNIVAGLNWYVGPGAQVGFFIDRGPYGYDNGIGLGVGGQVGIEYDFNTLDVPLLVSLDARPMFDFLSYYSVFGYGVGLSARYTW